MKLRITLLLLLLAGCWNYAAGQTTRHDVLEDIRRTGGIYYAYPADTMVQTPPPAGYRPFYISHYGRHGSRWLTTDRQYLDALETFRQADEAGKLTPLGEDVYERLQRIWEDARGRTGDLSPLGTQQHRDIAARMYRSFPEVFQGDRTIHSQSTPVVRCVLSMSAFDERLKELNPMLRITRDAYARDLAYMNHYDERSRRWMRDPDAAWRPEYEAFRERHIRPARLTALLFNDPHYVRRHIDSRSLMYDLFRIASSLQNVDLEVTLYDLFEPEELFDLWQVGNYTRYVTNGPAAVNGGMIPDNAKPLLRNFLDRADEALKADTVAATLRFGHDVNPMPLTALLEFEGYDTAVADPDEFYRVWSDYIVSPMAANVQWIFFRNDDSDDVLVKFLVNEKEASIPIPTDVAPYYHWRDVERFYRAKLDRTADGPQERPEPEVTRAAAVR